MNAKARKIIFWAHLTAGVSTGLVIFYLSLTGTLLAFKSDILNMTLPAGSGAPRTTSALENFKAVNPGVEVNGVTIWKDRGFFELQSGKHKKFINWDGSVIESSHHKVVGFFDVLINLHRWFSFENTGDHKTEKLIKGFCMIVFIFLIVSGIVLWAPAAMTALNFKLKDKARLFNQHSVLGFWFAPLLLLISLTGLVMAHQWANKLLFTIAGSEVPMPADKKTEKSGAPVVASFQNLDLLLKDLDTRAPDWKSISLKFSETSLVHVNIESPVALNVNARSQLMFDYSDGTVSKWEPFSEWSAGRKARVWMKPLHTGEWFGLFGEMLSFLASLTAMWLVWTGLKMTYLRFLQYRRRS